MSHASASGNPVQRSSAPRQHGGAEHVPGQKVHILNAPVIVPHPFQAPQFLGDVLDGDARLFQLLQLLALGLRQGDVGPLGAFDAEFVAVAQGDQPEYLGEEIDAGVNVPAAGEHVPRVVEIGAGQVVPWVMVA